MQENRSFDSFFGTFPGADGIPMRNGVPDGLRARSRTGTPASGRSTTSADRNAGGPHDHIDAVADIDGGKMDGFIKQAHQRAASSPAPRASRRRRCSLAPDRAASVMGYHDARELPNYWAWAKAFVLQDHLFESDTSWSLPAHLYLVSGWSARCSKKGDPMSCRPARPGARSPPDSPQNPTGKVPDYAWTDLTYLLHRHHVSWGYYVFNGTQPDCDDNAMFCKAGAAEREDARDLESAAVLRHGRAGPPARRHPAVPRLPRGRRRPGRCRRCRGSRRPRRSATTRRR